MAVGILLIIIGLVFLLDSLGVIGGITFGEIWPLFLIALGALIVWDRVRKNWRRR